MGYGDYGGDDSGSGSSNQEVSLSEFDVEIDGNDDRAFPLVPPGRYPAVIVSCKPQRSKSGGLMYAVQYEICGSKSLVRQWFSLDKYRDKLNALARAVSVPMDESGRYNAQEIGRRALGKPVWIQVIHEKQTTGKYAGRTNETVSSVVRRSPGDGEGESEDGLAEVPAPDHDLPF